MSAVTAEQLAKWKALADAATPGPWKSRGMGGDSVVLMPITSHRIGYSGDPTLCSLAEPRRFEDRDGRGFTDTSAGFLHDDARLVAAARTAVPALVAEVERLRERTEKMAAALDAILHSDANAEEGGLYDLLDSEGLPGQSGRLAEAIHAARAVRLDEPAK